MIIANMPMHSLLQQKWDVQVCTNDGFDPDWMTLNEGQIYLYRNKEECCQTHFWWRMTQCMANEEYKVSLQVFPSLTVMYCSAFVFLSIVCF